MPLSSITASPRQPLSLDSPAPPPANEPIPPSAAPSNATGDRRLVGLYAHGIRQAAQANTTAVSLANIPSDSTFGAWWQHLFDVTQSPVFLDWAKSKNIDTSHPITVNANSDTLIVTINGKRTTLEGATQGPGWRDATGPIMAAAKIFPPGEIDAPTRAQVAPLIRVARFYGEFLTPGDKSGTLARATQLEHNQGFDVLGPTTYVDVEAQSPEVLEQLKGTLGDSINQYNLSKQLLEFDRNGRVPLSRYVANTRVPVHPGSSYHQDTGRNDASLEELLKAGGWHVPDNLEKLHNLFHALTAPALPAPADGNFGGALAWPQPLSVDDQAELFRIIADNRPPLPGLPSEALLGSTDVLGTLVKKIPRERRNQADPLALMPEILGSGAAHNLGQALKQRMGEVAAHSTPREVLMTAIGVTLDAKSLREPKAGHVAGFDLAAPEHHGQPLAVIRQRLVEHLGTQSVTTPEAAPVAAMVLLYRAAPELAVRDVPADMTYGSFAWYSFKVAVGRIEAASPGASARMSFQEIVDRDAIDPVTDQEQAMQKQASRQATVEWGKAHGTLPLQGPYRDDQRVDTEPAIKQQEQAMANAVDAVAAKPPTQRDVALAELKAQMGEGIPFEEKSIRSNAVTTDSYRLTPSITTDPVGRYSLLDLYLSKKANLAVGWHSTNPKISAGVIRQVSLMADPITRHDQAFETYSSNLSKAWRDVTKNLISNLPLEDRKNIEWGKLTVYQRGESSRTNANTRSGSHSGSARFSPLENDRSLIIKTERNGETTYYEVDPLSNAVRRRDEWKNSFKEGLQAPEVKKTSHGVDTFTAPAIQPLSPPESDAGEERGVADGTTIPKSLSSERSEYLGKLLSTYITGAYSLSDLKESTRAVTTFDQEAARNELFRSFLLGLIPGASAVRNLVLGNYREAAADIIFDLVMAATTAGAGRVAGAARGAKALRKSLGKSLVDRFDASVRPGTGVARNGSVIPTRPSTQLNPGQLQTASRRADVAQGTVRGGQGVGDYRAVAKFDNAGNLVAFNPTTNRLFGRPLKRFEPARLTDVALKRNVQKVHQHYSKLGKKKPSDVCYNVSVQVAQAEKLMSPKVAEKLLNAPKPNGYPLGWDDVMGVAPQRKITTFDPASIKESGFINFYNKGDSTKAAHTAYIQRAHDGQLVLYNANSVSLDITMVGRGVSPEIAGRSHVYTLDTDGAANLQKWIGTQYEFAFTPAAEVNNRVARSL